MKRPATVRRIKSALFLILFEVKNLMVLVNYFLYSASNMFVQTLENFPLRSILLILNMTFCKLLYFKCQNIMYYIVYYRYI